MFFFLSQNNKIEESLHKYSVKMITLEDFKERLNDKRIRTDETRRTKRTG